MENTQQKLTLPEPGEIHVWQWGLDTPLSIVEASRNVLNVGEQQRAYRFFREIHRNYFTIGRACLRRVLARYLDVEPAALVFTYNDQGKPALANGPQAPFAFNLSHSGGQALLAIAGFSKVGIDIEACQASRDLLPIARRYFSATEQAELVALPPSEHTAAFYQCWSSKEALLKAWGTGLTTPLDKFSVGVAPGEVGVRSIDLPEWAGEPWTLYSVNVPKGYAAAVAVPGMATRLISRIWQTDWE